MNYYAPVHEGLIAPKHYQQMGDAVWLYIYFLQKETRPNGKVKHGSPLTDSELAGIFGVGEKQIRSWRRRLQKYEYIDASRAQYGYSYAIKKSKKFTATGKGSDRPLGVDVKSIPDRPAGEDQEGNSDRPLEDNSEIQIGLCTHPDRPLDAHDSLHVHDGEKLKGSGTKVLKKQLSEMEETARSLFDSYIEVMQKDPLLTLFTAEDKKLLLHHLEERLPSVGGDLRRATALISCAFDEAAKNDWVMARGKYKTDRRKNSLKEIIGTSAMLSQWLEEAERRG